MRVFIRCMLVALVLFITACARGELFKTSPTTLQLLCLGDSLTAQRIYPTALAAALQQSGRWDRVELTVLAEGGLDPAAMRARLADGRWALPSAAAGVERQALVLAGTNGYHPAVVWDLAEDLRNAGWSVAVLATPPRQHPKGKGYGFPQANRDFNQGLRPLVTAPLRWIDAREVLRDPAHPAADGDWLDPQWARDHTHLNELGYRRFAAAVAQELLDAK